MQAITAAVIATISVGLKRTSSNPSLSADHILVFLSFLALLWQILIGMGFPNQFFSDSWVVGFWRGRPWLAGHRIGETNLDAGCSRFWSGWGIKRGGRCVRSTCRG